MVTTIERESDFSCSLLRFPRREYCVLRAKEQQSLLGSKARETYSSMLKLSPACVAPHLSYRRYVSALPNIPVTELYHQRYHELCLRGSRSIVFSGALLSFLRYSEGDTFYNGCNEMYTASYIRTELVMSMSNRYPRHGRRTSNLGV